MSASATICKHCGKARELHLAHKLLCPHGLRTRIGYTSYGPTAFEPKEAVAEDAPSDIYDMVQRALHEGNVEVLYIRAPQCHGELDGAILNDGPVMARQVTAKGYGFKRVWVCTEHRPWKTVLTERAGGLGPVGLGSPSRP